MRQSRGEFKCACACFDNLRDFCIFPVLQFCSCAAGIRVRRVGACVSGSRHCIIKTYVLVATTNVGQASELS